MGWANGSELADNVWAIFSPRVCKKDHKLLALQLVDVFEHFDCDTMYECEFVEKFLEYDEDHEGWVLK